MMDEMDKDEMRLVWRERARHLSQPEASADAVPAGSGSALRCLVVTAGAERFGIAVSQVMEVLPVSEATPVPEAAPELWGLIAIRGDVYPAFDAGRLLPSASTESAEGPWHAVLLRGTQPAALRVDRAEEIVEVPLSQESGAETPAPDGAGTGNSFMKRIVVLGDGSSLSLLDVDEMLAFLQGEPQPITPEIRKDVS